MHNHLEPQKNGAESPFDSIKRISPTGAEYWSARDLMRVMAYGEWRRFKNPLRRAMKSAEVQGVNLEINFGRSAKVAGERGPAQEDFELSRFAAYLVAMNGDPNKPEVAAAQAYFAIQTRVAETQQAMPAIPQTYAEALRAAAEQAERAELESARAAKAEHTLELQAPKVAKAEAHSAVNEWKGRQEFSREIQKWARTWGHNIHQEAVYELLRRKGMLVTGNRRDRNHATAHAEKSGWATTKKGVTEDTGKPYATTRLSPKGQDLAWKWANKALYEYGEALNPAKDERKSA